MYKTHDTIYKKDFFYIHLFSPTYSVKQNKTCIMNCFKNLSCNACSQTCQILLLHSLGERNSVENLLALVKTARIYIAISVQFKNAVKHDLHYPGIKKQRNQLFTYFQIITGLFTG